MRRTVPCEFWVCRWSYLDIRIRRKKENEKMESSTLAFFASTFLMVRSQNSQEHIIYIYLNLRDLLADLRTFSFARFYSPSFQIDLKSHLKKIHCSAVQSSESCIPSSLVRRGKGASIEFFKFSK